MQVGVGADFAALVCAQALFCGPILEPIATFCCGGGAAGAPPATCLASLQAPPKPPRHLSPDARARRADIALNTFLEDLDGRIEVMASLAPPYSLHTAY